MDGFTVYQVCDKIQVENKDWPLPNNAKGDISEDTQITFVFFNDCSDDRVGSGPEQ